MRKSVFTCVVQRAFIPAIILALAAPAPAQWSSDPAANLAIADRNGDQNQAKVRAAPDGACYISWFDNSGAGYDVYLQRLNAQGVEQWAHNGVQIADRGYSSTQDYGLDVDAAGNAVIAYRDDRGGSSQVGVNLVAADGSLVWGPGGVLVSTTAGGNSPKVAATSDGHYVAGWSLTNGFRLQRLDAAGAPQWAADGIVQAPPAAGSYSLSEIIGSDDGSVIVLWVRPLGNITSNKHLYAQKYDTAGNPLWDGNVSTPGVNDPVIVFDATSVQIGYFPTFVSDGAGGGIFGWYENGGNRDAYVQHVSAAGAELFPHNGVSGSIQAGRLQLTPSVSYNATTGDIFLAWFEANTGQSQWGLYAQRYDSAGQRQWGDNALELVPLSGMQGSFVKTLPMGNGVAVFYFEQSSGLPGRVLGWRLNAAGGSVWGEAPLEVASLVNVKSRLDGAISAGGVAMLAWSDNRSDQNNVFAQNVNPDGTLGVMEVPPCDGDVNGDGVVDLADLATLLANFGSANATREQGDLDGDLDVDLADLATLLANFGSTC